MMPTIAVTPEAAGRHASAHDFTEIHEKIFKMAKIHSAHIQYTVKNRLATFPSPAGMSLTELPLDFVPDGFSLY